MDHGNVAQFGSMIARIDGDKIMTTYVGAEESRRNMTHVDPQAQAALGFFDEAKKLLETKKGAQ